MKHAAFVIAAALLTAACVPTTQALAPNDPRQVKLIQSECDLYYAVARDLAARGQSARGDLTAGCPTASAVLPSLAPLSTVPQAQDGYPELLYRRMIARGMPSEAAVRASKSAAFWNAVAARNAAQAG